MIDRHLATENGTSFEMATVAPTPEAKWVTAEEKNNRKPKQKLKIEDNKSAMEKVIICLAEFCGTAILVFMGCLSCVNGVSEKTMVTIAFSFGLSLVISIQTFGHISGSHINPIITLAAAVLGITPLMLVPIYFVGQFMGGLAGFGLVKAVVTANMSSSVCSVDPHKSLNQVEILGIEFLLSLLLVWTACGVLDKRNSKSAVFANITFALVIAGLALIGGPLTGAHMNPARTFGPSVINGTWKNSWMYWVGPTCAGLIGAFVYRTVFGKETSDDESPNETQ